MKKARTLSVFVTRAFLVAGLILSYLYFPFPSVAVAEEHTGNDTGTPGLVQNMVGPGLIVPWENPGNVMAESDFASAAVPFTGLFAEDTFLLPGDGWGVHTWEEEDTGHQLIAVGHIRGDSFTLLRWDGTELTSEATFALPQAGPGIHSWKEAGTGDRLIAVAHFSVPRFTLLRWDGASLTSEDTFTLPSTGYAVHTWEEAGTEDRLIAVGHGGTPSFTLLRWDGTELASEDTFTLPGTAHAVHTWDEGGGRLIAVGHGDSPHFTLLRWDGTELSSEGTFTLPNAAYDVHTWDEAGTGDRLIAVAHFDSPFFTLLRWDGASLTSEDTFTLPGFARAVHTWDEGGERLIAVGHTGSPHFTLLRWDSTELSSEDSYTLPGAVRAVNTWEAGGQRLIAAAHLHSPYFTLLSYGEDLVGPTLRLTATDFGLQIPFGASITGVEVEITKSKADEADDVTDHEVRLVVGGTVQGENKADTETQWSTEPASITYGSPTDTWGLDLYPRHVAVPGFGAAVSADASSEARVHHVTLTVYYQVDPDPGAGTEDDPYRISDWAHLDQVRYYLDAHFVLANNLDETSSGYDDLAGPLAHSGSGWEPIATDSAAPFAGTLDGQGHTISDMYVNWSGTDRRGGLIGVLAGEIKNLGVEDILIEGAPGYYVGAIAGHMQDGIVETSYATGEINVSDTYDVGGLVGYLEEGEIRDSFARVDIVADEESVGGLVGANYRGTISNCYAAGSVGGESEVGGLVGYNEGDVMNSYATGSVAGDEHVGGLVGLNEGLVRTSYATGDVSGSSKVGGFVGDNRWGATIEDSYARGSVTRTSGTSETLGGFAGFNRRSIIGNSYSTGSVHYEGADDPTDKGFVGDIDTAGDYADENNFWDTLTSGQTTTAGDAVGKTTAQMKDVNTYLGADWDIEVTSAADPTDGYPFLAWQLGSSPTWYIYEPPPILPPVGGTAYPVNRLALLAPWIALAAMAAGAVIFVRRRQTQN